MTELNLAGTENHKSMPVFQNTQSTKVELLQCKKLKYPIRVEAMVDSAPVFCIHSNKNSFHKSLLHFAKCGGYAEKYLSNA